jgi:hypothetical protein
MGCGRNSIVMNIRWFPRPLVSVAVLVGSLIWFDDFRELHAAGILRAGVGKADITNEQAGPIHDRLYAKALVLKDDSQIVAIITVDAVSLGEIGYISNDFLPQVRAQLSRDCGISPECVVINASHCHGIVCADVAERTVQAARDACQNLVPVQVGCGVGHEDRIMENRRLKLKKGQEADVRHAYALPPDADVVSVGPVDPEIGLLRFDREDGSTLAVIYNFACHPIQGVPAGGITADLIGFASRVIEENLGAGTMALFLQGCAGDINPIWYKDVDHPRDAEPLGNQLGLSALKGLRTIRCEPEAQLAVVREVLSLPRANFADRIQALEQERDRLVRSLQGTSLNLKTFLPLIVKYKLAEEYPAYYSHRYLHDQAAGRDDLPRMDADNLRNIDAYVSNIHIMEELTRVQVNLALLRQHQVQNETAKVPTLEVELMGIRLGSCVLITFPGELTIQIGLNIKQASPHEFTFVAGYTNGYIYYAPTAEQLANPGAAQEDCDCLLAPAWQEIFESKVAEMLRRL